MKYCRDLPLSLNIGGQKGYGSPPLLPPAPMRCTKIYKQSRVCDCIILYNSLYIFVYLKTILLFYTIFLFTLFRIVYFLLFYFPFSDFQTIVHLHNLLPFILNVVHVFKKIILYFFFLLRHLVNHVINKFIKIIFFSHFRLKMFWNIARALKILHL